MDYGEKVDVFTGLGDFEDHRGRKNYASKVTGAYYAARLGVLEYLQSIRRQAACFVYREITDEYWAPLGVWVIRESVRKALQGKPRTYDTLENARFAISNEVRIKRWSRKSKLFEQKKQKRLEDFLT